MFEVEPVGLFNLGHAQKPVKKKWQNGLHEICPLFFTKLYTVDVTESVWNPLQLLKQWWAEEIQQQMEESKGDNLLDQFKVVIFMVIPLTIDFDKHPDVF